MESVLITEPRSELAETEMTHVVLRVASVLVDQALALIGSLPARAEMLTAAERLGFRRAGALTNAEFRQEVRRAFPGDGVLQAVALDAFSTATRASS